MSTAPLLLSLFAPSGQGGPGMSAFIIQIALFIAIFYFLLIRPQRRQQQEHKQLLASLQRGDKDRHLERHRRRGCPYQGRRGHDPQR